MKAGYAVIKDIVHTNPNCVVVVNYEESNEIINYFYNEKNPKQVFEEEIGVWKIKQLKQSK